jgi:hypothetical protein
VLKILALLLVSASFGDEPFEIEAETLSASPKVGVFHAEGDVVLRRPGFVAYADWMTFFEKEQRVEAGGHVILVEGLSVTRCRSISFKVPELIGGLASAELRIKRGISPERLGQVPKAQLGFAGEEDVLVRAEHLEKTGPKTFAISKGLFTPCHCAEDATPSWHIETSSATIDLDSGASLHWPLFYIKGMPVMGLPRFYFPLGTRRSGLLMPRVQHSSVTGWSLNQPLYLTLGRSADATLGFRHFFDRGPSPEFELRWASSRSSNGWLRLSSLLDYGVYEPNGRTWSATADEAEFRFSVAGLHRQNWGRHRVGVQINATGDPSYISEFADKYLSRQVEYTQSRATYSFNDASHVRVAAGFNLMQDLRAHRYRGFDPKSINLFSGTGGPDGNAGPAHVRYRFADLRLDALPSLLLEGALPIYIAAVLNAQGFAAPWPTEPRFGRVDFRPHLFLPVNLGGLFSFETELAGRMTSWTGRFMSVNHDANRWAAISRSRLSTEITRAYTSVTHRLRPAIRHVFIPKVYGDDPGLFANGDEIDLLASAHQVSFGISSDWLRKRTGSRAAYVGVNAGYDLSKRVADESQTAETKWAPLSFRAGISGPFFDGLRGSLSSSAFLDVEEQRLEEFWMSGRLQWGRAMSMNATWLHLADEVSRRTFIAPEEIMPSSTMDRSAYLAPTLYRAQLASDNLDVVPWSAYQGLLLSAVFRPLDPLTVSGGFSLDYDSSRIDDQIWNQFKQISGALRWDSPCKCWSAALIMTKARDRESPDVRFVLDLARLGGVAY